MKKFYVYVIKNKIDSYEYVGKTWDPEGRWVGHQKASKKTVYTSPLYISMRKDGIENFRFMVLSTHRDSRVCLAAERRAIKKRNTIWPNGYNLTTGGEGTAGIDFSILHKIHMSESWTPERRAAQSKLWTPTRRKAFGKNASRLNKEKASDPEYRKKLSLAWTPERHAAHKLMLEERWTAEYKEKRRAQMKEEWRTIRKEQKKEFAIMTIKKNKSLKQRKAVKLGFKIRKEFITLMNQALDKICARRS